MPFQYGVECSKNTTGRQKGLEPMQQIRRFKQNKKTLKFERPLICNNTLAGAEGFELWILGLGLNTLLLGVVCFV